MRQRIAAAAIAAMEVDTPTAFEGSGSGVDAAAPTVRAGRRDGRGAGALRSLTATQGALARADGSARVRAGMTDVIAAVYGPMDCPIHRQDAAGADVFVCYRGAGVGDRRKGGAADEVAGRDLRAAVREVLCRRLFPRKAVAIGVHVLCDDGGAVAAAVNAAFLALVDAGVAMRGMLSAVCLSVHNGGVVVDPEEVEEAEADGVLTFTFDGGVEGDDAKDLVGVCVVGDVGGAQLFEDAAAVARQLCRSTRGFMKLALTGKAAAEN